ncbi:hypothetical protein T08_3027 [Trichinella sp. T8]|nr:hypothetical protein T08_3027 [Trichinella sp. T8]
MPPQRHLLLINFYTIDLKPTVHYRVIGLSSPHRHHNDGLRCQNKVEETDSEPNPLNQLLEELDELCIASADACEIKDQISMTKRLYLETEAL